MAAPLTPHQSDTPRTDEFSNQLRGLGVGYYQAIDFARQLERENAALKKRAESAEKEAVDFWQTTDGVLPRIRELIRSYKDRYGAAHTKDFDDAVKSLESILERTQ